MEIIDMKKLETAIVYLERIAEGHNPNVIRYMYFVKDNR